MEKYSLETHPAYAGASIILTTKHKKSIAIAPPFLEKLKANVLEYAADTDTLGSFSGEIERENDPLACAKIKCSWPFERLSEEVYFALASEGSFGPHPLIPFLFCDYESLYFIDKKNGFHLHLSHLSEKTNYRTETIDSIESLYRFSEAVKFPSHALILRPNDRQEKRPVFKGINSKAALEAAFKECMQRSSRSKVFIETDMRAQFNPSRMSVINELANRFADRLAKRCPKCRTPGWGIVSVEKGLPCSDCGSATALVKSEVFGCAKCAHKEIIEKNKHQPYANPMHCGRCNP